MMSRLCVTSRLQKQRGEAIVTHWGPPTQCAFYENSLPLIDCTLPAIPGVS